MKPLQDSSPPVDADTLDRLVDGELSEGPRRQLLESLDQTPGGWRACALAFLEAQAWRTELRSTAAVAQRPPTPSAASVPQIQQAPRELGRRPPSRIWRHRGSLAAMAASFLLALVAGVTVRDGWRRPDASVPQSVEVDSTAAPLDIAAARPGRSVPAPLAGSPSSPIQMVTLGLPGDPQGSQRTIRVPAVKADRLDESLLRPDGASLPPNVLRALERMGYEVRHNRELCPVPLQDGGQLVLPVDQWEVQHSGKRAYQ